MCLWRAFVEVGFHPQAVVGGGGAKTERGRGRAGHGRGGVRAARGLRGRALGGPAARAALRRAAPRRRSRLFQTVRRRRKNIPR